jgi:CDGSH-type Zn-finger protein
LYGAGGGIYLFKQVFSPGFASFLVNLYPPNFPYSRRISMAEPIIAQKSPYPVEVEAGKSYYWCSCGQSANQPFCDGSHKTTEFTPVKFEATETKTVYFCGCKHTANPGFCDGSHTKL